MRLKDMIMNIYKYNRGDYVDPKHRFRFIDYGKGTYIVQEECSGLIFEANRYLLRKGQIACAPQRRKEYRSNLYRKYHVGDILGPDNNIEMIDDAEEYGYLQNKNGKKVRKYLWKNLDTNQLFIATVASVLSGNTSGIKTSSKGENKINQILSELQINFIAQYSFSDCVNPLTSRKLKFDFYLPDYNCCIEYDGKQHYHKEGTYAELEGFDKIKYRDQIKNDYCVERGIKLIRIPFNQYQMLNSDMLYNFIVSGDAFNIYSNFTAEVIKRFTEAGY